MVVGCFSVDGSVFSEFVIKREDSVVDYSEDTLNFNVRRFGLVGFASSRAGRSIEKIGVLWGRCITAVSYSVGNDFSFIGFLTFRSLDEFRNYLGSINIGT